MKRGKITAQAWHERKKRERGEVRAQFWLPPERAALIDKMAAELDVSRAELVRRLVDNQLRELAT